MVKVAHLKKFIDTLEPSAEPEKLRELVKGLGPDNEVIMSGFANDILGVHADEFFRLVEEDPEYLEISCTQV